MLKTLMLHPEILCVLGRSGHGARILIADSNYPVSTASAASAKRVYLNLRSGMIPALAVLEVLVQTVPVESAIVMQKPDGGVVPIHGRYREILGPEVPLTAYDREGFYQEARSPSTALVIATGESRRFANLLLMIGVVAGVEE
ncbi:MAG: RbsD/FucU family protein [Phycisphaerae bacterium]